MQARAGRIVAAPRPQLHGLLMRDGLSGTDVAAAPGRLLVPAEPSVSLIVNLAGAGERAPVGLATAPGRRFGSTAPPGHRSWATMTLTLPGAFRVLGWSLGELDRPVLDLVDIFGRDGRELAERLRTADGWDARFALMTTFLADRARRGPAPSPEVTWVWRRLVRTGGALPIRGLADDVGWSHQHLIRAFHRHFGLPPKVLARLLRLRRVLRRVRADGVRWDHAAPDAGYYDQAHFARDLRDFTGTTPARYGAAALPCGCLAG